MENVEKSHFASQEDWVIRKERKARVRIMENGNTGM